MTEKVIDTVCGMKIDESEAKATAVHKGKTYYFCSESCKEQFDKKPEKYSEE